MGRSLTYDGSVATGRNERLKPVHRDRLADQAHGAIREAIITGKFDTGERLIETRLAADLGMSRAPVREAIQRLAEEGLVTEHPHQGTFVTILTADDVVDFYNVRLGIETTAVRLFMRRACSTEPLRAKIQTMPRAAARRDANSVVRAELEFHESSARGAPTICWCGCFRSRRGG